MAHNAHNIPWQNIAADLKYIEKRFPLCSGRTNMFPMHKPGQAGRWNHFVRVFTKTIEDCVVSERSKYSDAYEPFADDEPVISKDVAARIGGTVTRYCQATFHGQWDKSHCVHCYHYHWEPWMGSSPEKWGSKLNDPKHNPKCSCVTSHTSATMSAFLVDWRRHSMDPYPSDSLEITKILILHREMETLLRLVAHPGFCLSKRWSQCCEMCWGKKCGMEEMLDMTLMAYICLNVLYLHPETWDEQYRKARDKMDYRKTSAYQMMLVRCTRVVNKDLDTHMYPHREFFGVPRNMFPCQGCWDNSEFGTGDLQEIALQKEYLPNNSNIPEAINILGSKGLPVELSLEILELADYRPAGRLPIPDDPLHVRNAQELRKYLRYCWKMLVNIRLLCQESGETINWEEKVADCVWKLWGQDFPKMLERTYPYGEEDRAVFVDVDKLGRLKKV
ncbi:hypothetical protein K402DRAFT_339382 [Aulographum hederae CBS 113979]|uniref:Uncharacterized protein n=1 Tax=Aulographum hederae CBS 113979 TaxID=1176131 RepID=A0A6G1GQ91_9PEZI|nr:hypothetical protein K402DRAFT_339382 [Aulographum hederae CBS 113979]